MQVWSLSHESLNQLDGRLQDAARNTNRWHHQISFDDKRVAFARTRHSDQDNEIQIVTLSESPLSVQVDKAIGWIDRNDLPNGFVRLLTIPAFHIDAFWIEVDNDDLIVLVSAPDQFTDIETRRVYTKSEFSSLLSQVQAIEGVPGGNPNLDDDGRSGKTASIIRKT